MWIFSLLFVWVTAAILADRFGEDICDTFPMSVAGSILLLYLLAFFQKLPLIDFLVLPPLFLIVLLSVKCIRKNGWDVFRERIHPFLDIRILTLFAFMIVVTVLVKDRIAVWWDDINFWASDAKSLFYLNGFAPKYGNVSPEFGDYPPAIQLFKWWFLHTDKTQFREGMLFAAYYCMNLIFLFPLLKRLKRKNFLFLFTGCIILFLIPGIVDSMWTNGACADVTMGIIYGALLCAIWDDANHSEAFYILRMILYTAVLVLTKSVGIEWACFAVVFFFLMHGKERMKRVDPPLFKKYKCAVWMILTACLCSGSWFLFCFTHRRVAKLTSSGVKIALGGNFALPENTMEKAGYFLKGFFYYPLHDKKTFAWDLSAFTLLVIVVFCLIIYLKANLLSRKESGRLLIFTGITSFAAYAIIFIGHITIFAGELQYLEVRAMALSLARYGAPFALGMICLLMYIFIQRTKSLKGYIVCLIFVLLTTTYPGVFHSLWGYKTDVAKESEARNQMIEESAKRFLTTLSSHPDVVGQRTLYLRDDKQIHWVKDTYISYEASPAAVVYGGIATDTMDEDFMEQKILQSHAAFLYADKVEGDPAPLFGKFMDQGQFCYETLYQITQEDGKIKLMKKETSWDREK